MGIETTVHVVLNLLWGLCLTVFGVALGFILFWMVVIGIQVAIPLAANMPPSL